jgi:TonB-dependent Receptor Plug Domain
VIETSSSAPAVNRTRVAGIFLMMTVDLSCLARSLATAAAAILLGSADIIAQVPPNPPPLFTVTVVGTTPLPGAEIPIDWAPAPIQTATDRDLRDSGALDVSDFLTRRLNGVYANEIQNNPFQPDINYRGYTASPLLGTPQGVSVYMDGVRVNQPFGDVVSWDLIPRIAIANIALMPGSNPVFGLNTLGGALSLQMKDGRSSRGTIIQATYGSDVRRAIEFEHGGHNTTDTLHWYVAGSLFGEDGWRDDSPSDVRQIFGKVGWQRSGREWTVSLGHANNSLTGNGLQDTQLLDRDYDSVYTKPDTTDNRSTLVTVTGRHRLGSRLSVLANAWYRDLRTRTLNGDINEDSLDEPPGTPNGLISRTRTTQRNGGLSAQLSGRGTIESTIYAGYSEGSRAATSIELGCAGSRSPLQAAQRDGGRSAARSGRHAHVGRRHARHARQTSVERRPVPRRESRRHPVRHVRADRVRLLYERRPDTSSGHRARREGAARTRDDRRRLHVPARDLRERRDAQRREQQHEPDDVYYLGSGTSDAYAIVNLGARYDVTDRVQVLAEANNLFDRRYATAAQLGPAGFTNAGTFIARPFPAVNGEFPVRQTTFLAPGAPRRAWAGLRLHF